MQMCESANVELTKCECEKCECVYKMRMCMCGFKRGSQNCTQLSGRIGRTDPPNMTSPPDFSRLENAIKYCTKVQKIGAAGQRVK